MKIKTLFFILIFFITNALIGQSLNEYKYVEIPAKFDFLKSENQYQLNDLTKFLFEKEGFVTYFNNTEVLANVAENPCSALTANVLNESNMFTTKLVIELVNCKNQKVLVTKEGRSKQKDYKKGYQEALREAFEDVTAQNYNYKGKTITANVDNTVEDARKAINEAVEEVVEEAEEPEVIEIIESSENENTEEIGITEVVEVKEEVTEKAEMETENMVKQPSNLLYAQANAMGYQLVDSSPKVVFVLLTSSIKNVYILKNKNGMIYKQNGTWVAEYFNGTELVKKPLEIKF